MFLFGKKKKITQKASAMLSDTNETMSAFHKESQNEIEIYIHIPFCLKKCLYCDFLSGVSQSKQAERQYIEDLKQEIVLSAETVDLSAEPQTGPAGTIGTESGQGVAKKAGHGKHKGESIQRKQVRSIFVGGGTPTAIDPALLADVLACVKEHFPVKEDAEITVECNPGTATAEGLKLLRCAGYNRISIGMQSADEALLKTLGRIHTYEDTKNCTHAAKAAGFTNISLDLMSALPGQTLATYMDTLYKAISLKPDHISAYSLIVEPGTPFEKLYGPDSEGHKLLPSEENDRQMYYDTKRILAAAGYERYEISNYSKPGYECIHNLGYWTGYDYLGFGLGASSLWDRTRYHNVNTLDAYHKAVLSGDLGFIHQDVQKLTRKECMEEHMFLGLRTSTGISKSDFEQKFGVKYETVLGPATNKLLRQKLIDTDGDRIFLTDLGLDVSNRVFVEFLLDDDY